MKILFIHQNYPGQFRHLAPALAARGDDVRALTCRVDKPAVFDGVRVNPYRVAAKPAEGGAAWAREFEERLLYGYFCAGEAQKAQKAGYSPDVIVGHPGWGETMFLKHIWPEARLGLYCELYYDPDHPATWPARPLPDDYQPPLRSRLRLRVRNVNTRLHDDIMDAGICPTRFQLESYPHEMRERITLQHDGVDTDFSCSDPDVHFALPDGRELTRADEVITYVARSLEPMRGFDVFMRALPDLLRVRPNAQILVVGREDVSYGGAAPDGKSWKQHFMEEVGPQIAPEDIGRVHFLGNIPHPEFRRMLQVSRVHIYLTYPFVVSWSLLEALSTGCAVVASDGPSVREIITGPELGQVVPFPDPAALVEGVVRLCEDPARRAALAEAGRAHILKNYDLRTACMPAQINWIDRLAAMTPRKPLD